MVHLFLLSPGIWNGQGKVTFNSSPDIIPFYTQWEVFPTQNNIIEATQKVEMEGTKETLLNHYRLHSLSPDAFLLELTNELLGKVEGRGLIKDKQIGWEFRGQATFEGFEAYCLDDQGDYALHAEYASPDQYRTIINGRLWQRVHH